MVKCSSFLSKLLYWYVSYFDKQANILFLNYGYDDPNQKVDLNPEEEVHRPSIQLYHHITESVCIKDKDVVEVGCGRGGGLSYIVRRWAPASAIGIDLCKEAVRFCGSSHGSEKLSFCHGNAEDLPLDNESCDILINVESSHRYENFEKFISEVCRVLRKGGLFSFADYRSKRKFQTCRMIMEKAQLAIIKEEIINQQVVLALQNDWDNKAKIYKHFVPLIFRNIGLYFGSKVQSRLIEKFQSHKKIYFHYICQKR